MKSWIISRQDENLSRKIADSLKISELTARVLVNRGIKTPEDAEKFIYPKLSHFEDPFLIPDIKKACERIISAKEKKEKVVIYGDYDVDGVSATSILVETLNFLDIDVSFYIPSRYGEGYSLNMDSIKKLKDLKTDLIITVDCGVSSLKEVDEATRLGLDTIITDHHNLPRELPKAYAIVNPKRGTSGQNLSGAGVAFKLAWALIRLSGIKENSLLLSLLDLAALGTIADVVPLSGENRIIAKQGIEVMKSQKRAGLRALIEGAKIKEVTIREVNFAIAPRLNAAGRLEHASISVELLTTKDEEKAREIAKELSKINTKRQGIGDFIHTEILSKLENIDTKEEKLLLLSGENWHPGVIGIIASRIVDKHKRPTVLIGINEGVGRGSARSIDGINIYKILENCKDLFVDFGGHEGAAGFEIDPEKIPEFEKRLKETLIGMEFDFTQKILIDAEIPSGKLNLKTVEELNLLSPYGQGNKPPIFVSYKMVLKDFKTVGASGAHLKANFFDGVMEYDSIWFSKGGLAKELKSGQKYDLVFSPQSNIWNGFETVQLNLIDLKPSL